MAQSHLQKLNCRCEVTAVKFICNGTFLLTGQGPFLTLYDSSNGSYINSYQLLSANKIHGIRAYPVTFNDITFIIIFSFGARELSISTFNPITKSITALHSPLLLNDWIFDTALLTTNSATNPSSNSQTFELAVGMMHNQVLLYLLTFTLSSTAPPSPPTPSTSTIEIVYKLMETVLSENTSILYSLSFHGTHRHNLMVAAGDCFNHVESAFSEPFTFPLDFVSVSIFHRFPPPLNVHSYCYGTCSNPNPPPPTQPMPCPQRVIQRRNPPKALNQFNLSPNP